MLAGKKVIVQGDGTSLWTLTHNSDFAVGLTGLLGNPHAIGETFHITSDEWLSWNQIFQIIGQAAGIEAHIVHVPSDHMGLIEDGQMVVGHILCYAFMDAEGAG